MQRFAQIFMILASVAALVSTVQPAAAGKYCLQGRIGASGATASSPRASGAWRVLLGLLPAAASIRDMPTLGSGALSRAEWCLGFRCRA
jgi:hypothetical protein